MEYTGRRFLICLVLYECEAACPFMVPAERSHMAKQFQKLTFSDSYIFGQVMKDPVLCRKVLEVLLGEDIGELEPVETERTMQFTKDGKPIRLDILTRENRTGRYHDVMSLRGSYLEMGQKKIFFNTKSQDQEIPDEVRRLFDYIETGDIGNALTEQIETAVLDVKGREDIEMGFWSVKCHDDDIRDEGRAEGREEGREEGRDLLAASIERIRAGATGDELLADGVDEKTVEFALKYA